MSEDRVAAQTDIANADVAHTHLSVQLEHLRQALRSVKGDGTAAMSVQDGVAQTISAVTRSADAAYVSIAKWDLLGANGAMHEFPIQVTAKRTESGLWVSTLRVQGRYTSLPRFVAFAAGIGHGGIALEELHMHEYDYDLLIDVYGTCKGCVDAAR
ncbi:hypothetical protein [Robbsia andropogonis]|uniref:hypothetical protein n=1 Tax=Robbsia andropogonis TaxID=28092 RepID=UPI002A6A603D|nr:hypothetical protein [Robbsia andropogonis]